MFVDIHVVGQVVSVPKVEHFEDQGQIVLFTDLEIFGNPQVLLEDVRLTKAIAQQWISIEDRFVAELAVEVAIDAGVRAEGRPGAPLHDRAELQPERQFIYPT